MLQGHRLKDIALAGDEYKEKLELSQMHRSNLPFYYYSKADLDKVELLLEKISSTRNKKEAQLIVDRFKYIISEFKQRNPQMYPRRKNLTSLNINNAFRQKFRDDISASSWATAAQKDHTK